MTAIRYISGTAFRDSHQPPPLPLHVRFSPWVVRALDAADNGEGLSQGRRVITCATCGLRRRDFQHGRCRRCAFVATLVAAYPPEGA